MFEDIIKKKKRLFKASWIMSLQDESKFFSTAEELYGPKEKHVGFCLAEYEEEFCQDCYAHKNCLKLFDIGVESDNG